MAETAADLAALDARLQAAARAGDAVALARDYRCAADHAARDGKEDAAGFYLTHAYVWALVAGDAAGAASLARDLRRQGRLD
jgi:hypothetical protein